MGRLSRGCLPCRQRRVRCDEGKPACRRCLARSEVCEGYRDESSLIFRHETDKVVHGARAAATASASTSSGSSTTRKRGKSVEVPLRHPTSATAGQAAAGKGGVRGASDLAPGDLADIRLGTQMPWLKDAPRESQAHIEEQATEQFLEQYVVYPCNQTSSPGFLEHLPSMFKDVNVPGREALRWAVQAASYADMSRSQDGDDLARKALQCYGMALKALGASLAEPGKVPDDHDLMTVVMLDIFESLHAPEQARKGSHAQGMAQILRLRGPDIVYSPRGWSLFRLAQHRIQKQEISFNMTPVPGTVATLNQLNDNEPHVRLQKSTQEISETCRRAQSLLELIDRRGLPASTIVDMIRELHSLDQTAVSWRQRSDEWSFTDLPVATHPHLARAASGITDTVQLHADAWMAYEWNYHRAARITFLERLHMCALAALKTPNLEEEEGMALRATMAGCTSTVQWLAGEILATVPQSLGDVDCTGRPHDSCIGGSSNSSSSSSSDDGAPRCQSIGGYLLLWPIKTTKSESFHATREQKDRASRVYERIRDCTGMKALLGDKSLI